MPDHEEAGDLSVWEAEYQNAVSATVEPTTAETLFDEVFDFGRVNLYGAFDAERTVREFEHVKTHLQSLGVALDERWSTRPDLSTW
ncbi:MAG: hypothetical protein AAF845_17315 [Bacteroidota bacterium]